MAGGVSAHDRGKRPGVPVKQDLLMPGDWDTLQRAQRVEGQRDQSLLVPAGTEWVESSAVGVAEEVSRRWPNLRIASCKCNMCLEQGHYPHVVCELTRSGQTVAVLGFIELDRRVVDTLWAMSHEHDQQKLADEHNSRMREQVEKRRNEARRERLEVIQGALESRKHDWRGPGGVRTNPHLSSSQAAKLLGR